MPAHAAIVTVGTERSLQFQEVNPLGILKELLLVHLPAQTYTAEGTPTVAGSEDAGTVATDAGINKVTLAVVVAHATEDTLTHDVVCVRINMFVGV